MTGTEQPPSHANIIIQLESEEGNAAGPQLDVPQDVTPSQLETLLNGLQHNEERLSYSFFIHDQELAAELGTHLLKHQVSVEAVLRIVYQPQAVFKVRAVTRCTASLGGHAGASAVPSINTPREAVLSVNFSPDGNRVASGSGDTSVRLWDLHTQTPQFTCNGHASWVLVVAWSPDAAVVASGDHDGGLWLWEPATGKAMGQCKGHRKFITSIAWQPAHIELPSRRFCSGSKDTTIKVWDASTRRCLFTMSNHTQAITQVKWGGDGLIYSAGRDCSINVWAAADGRLLRSLTGHGHWVNTMSLSTDYVLRTGPFDHTGVAPDDIESRKQVAQQRYDAARHGLPERLATGSDDFTLFLWDPSNQKQPRARMTGHMQLVNQACLVPISRLF
ncbi:Notchless protein [Chlorella vulgaris]